MFKIMFSDGRDFTGKYLTVSFKDGIGETDNPYLAERFLQKGLLVEVTSPEGELGKKVPTASKSFDKMSASELKSYAEQNGIDVSEAKNNTERLGIILAATQSPEQE